MKRKLSAYVPYHEIEKQAFLGSVIPMAQAIVPTVASIGAQFYLPNLLRKNLQRFSRLSSMRDYRASKNPGMAVPPPIFSKGVRNFINKTLYNHNSFGGSLINHMAIPWLVGKVTDPFVNTLSSGLNLLPSFQKTGMFLKRGKISPSLLKIANASFAIPSPGFTHQGPIGRASGMSPTTIPSPGFTHQGPIARASGTSPAATPSVATPSAITPPAKNSFGSKALRGAGMLGAGVGMYNAYNDFQKGNYGNAAIQAASSAAPYALPALQKALPMAAGKALGKFIPYAGTAISAADAANRWSQGDRWGAAISGLQAGANLIPGAGTAISMGLEAVDALRPNSTRYDLSNSAKSVKELAES